MKEKTKKKLIIAMTRIRNSLLEINSQKNIEKRVKRSKQINRFSERKLQRSMTI